MESNPVVKIENGTDVTIVTFQEENILEEQQIRKLERLILPVIRDRPDKRLVLNFENVRFMSSAFLGLLVKVHKRVIEAGGRLQLYNLDPKIYKVFQITKLTTIFDIVPTTEEKEG
jgi:anti-anti-sigma factor